MRQAPTVALAENSDVLPAPLLSVAVATIFVPSTAAPAGMVATWFGAV